MAEYLTFRMSSSVSRYQIQYLKIKFSARFSNLNPSGYPVVSHIRRLDKSIGYPIAQKNSVSFTSFYFSFSVCYVFAILKIEIFIRLTGARGL